MIGNPLSYTLHTINSKWIKNVIPETIKLQTEEKSPVVLAMIF